MDFPTLYGRYIAILCVHLLKVPIAQYYLCHTIVSLKSYLNLVIFEREFSYKLISWFWFSNYNTGIIYVQTFDILEQIIPDATEVTIKQVLEAMKAPSTAQTQARVVHRMLLIFQFFVSN